MLYEATCIDPIAWKMNKKKLSKMDCWMDGISMEGYLWVVWGAKNKVAWYSRFGKQSSLEVRVIKFALIVSPFFRFDLNIFCQQLTAIPCFVSKCHNLP